MKAARRADKVLCLPEYHVNHYQEFTQAKITNFSGTKYGLAKLECLPGRKQSLWASFPLDN